MSLTVTMNPMRGLVLILVGLLAACSQNAPTPQFHADDNPRLLSEWGQLGIVGAELRTGAGVVTYDLNTPLFTDYALKLRTIWMPEGVSADYRENDVLDFPVGTVITKTFYYASAGGPDRVSRGDGHALVTADGHLDLDAVQLIETRILVRRENGWAALPYRWNEDQTEAVLLRYGDVIPLQMIDADGSETGFNYVMPDVNQCASCHAPDSNTRIISPIGPKPRHINRDFDYPDGTRNQLDHLTAIGYLTGAPQADTAPRNADWADINASLEARARAYLDANCSHCHSPVGPADTSGLNLEPDIAHGPALGICKLPIAAGSGTGDRRHDIVPGAPDESILLFRLDNVQPDEMMPEVGRSTIHTEGVELIRAWIESLPGDCN
ncbi:SO2930 family diheme c-type cytochrome [Maricaulis maris]|uniref:SO2930 family diheme c-type cytochrome n=1 Tax=Maricaulis maris TaxID=74318 RepID=UPI001F297BC2|nr:SO2930 family diheme c-type cytochrome [Maricaulis maris]